MTSYTRHKPLLGSAEAETASGWHLRKSYMEETAFGMGFEDGGVVFWRVKKESKRNAQERTRWTFAKAEKLQGVQGTGRTPPTKMYKLGKRKVGLLNFWVLFPPPRPSQLLQKRRRHLNSLMTTRWYRGPPSQKSPAMWTCKPPPRMLMPQNGI